ncbi:MAG: ABC transporter permease [Candidatus Aenigmatarchaeota archaeon]
MNNKIDIILVLTEKELKSKYKRSLLGYIWSMLNPLFMGMVIYIAFSEIMKFKVENYPFYLLTGLFVWQWIAISINNSLYVYIHNATIIKKTNFDRKLLNVALVNSESIHFLISLPVLLLIFFISTDTNFFELKDFKGMILFPFVFFFTYIFILGISLIVSVINVIFRDIERITNILLQIIFYTSPIVYPRDLPPEKYRVLLDLNPVTHIVEAWRNLFNKNIIIEKTIILIFISILIFIIGYFAHEKLKYKMVEYL